ARTRTRTGPRTTRTARPTACGVPRRGGPPGPAGGRGGRRLGGTAGVGRVARVGNTTAPRGVVPPPRGLNTDTPARGMTMPENNSTLRAVAYYRKSNEDDGNSIDQQREWAHDVCPKEDLVLVREFSDRAKRGWDTAKRTDFHEMLDFCRQQARQGTPVD